jgi:hypothetical protein
MQDIHKHYIGAGIASILTLITGYKLYTEYKVYKKQKYSLEFVKSHPIQSIKHAIEEYAKIKDTKKKGLAKLESLVLVTGVAEPYNEKGGKKSEDNRWKEIFIERKPRFLNMIKGEGEEHESSRSVCAKLFYLLDEHNNKIVVQPYSDTRSISLQSRIVDKVKRWDVLLSIFTSFFLKSFGELYLDTKEYIAYANQNLTIFGVLSYNSSLNLFQIEKPKFILGGGKHDLTKFFKNFLFYSKAKITFFGIFFAVGAACLMTCVYSIGKEHYKKYQARKLDEMHRRIPRIFIDGYKCIVCNENPRNVIFENCHHFVCCRECQENFHERVCPTCRARIEDTIQVYFN